MSTVKTVKYQVGTDGTSTNNFTIYQPDPPDGTMRIGVGNADNPTEIAQFTSSGLNASALTGTLPAIDGSALTGVSSYADSDALSLFNASGSAPVYAPRAWVNFNGSGTVAIKASGNVSSITDNGVGDYTINFTTAMPDANYAASAFTCAYAINFGGALAAYYPTGTSTYIPQTKTTSAARILTGYTNVGGLNDNAEMSFIVYR